MARAPRKKPARKKKPPPKIDLEPFQTAVNEAASRVRGLWLGYIALLAYLFIAVGAVTHQDLLLQNPVKLPVLNVELPLIGFFAIAPIFMLINHFYLLLQLLELGRRIRLFNDEIAKSSLNEEDSRDERRKLDTFIIVQMLGGAREETDKLTGNFLKIIALITLVIAPVALLLSIQLQFLPYQYELVTWMHRIAIAIDLALLWAFWPSIKLGDWAPWRGTPLRAAAVAIVMLFSCVIATFPGEFADGGVDYVEWNKTQNIYIKLHDWRKPQDSYLWKLKDGLFGDLTEGAKRARLVPFPFSRALNLADDKTLINPDKLDKIRKRHRDNKDRLEPWQTGRTLSLRDRNLRGARFDRSDLRNVDFSGANLQGASLEEAELQGALLSEARLHGASLFASELQGASLASASLQDARLESVHLQGAWLNSASLGGASLVGAKLQGAWLHGARLQGATLDYASLQGASLVGASLQGASLVGASLQGASLVGANLQGASLEEAELQGALLLGVSLEGASLDSTFLWRAYFEDDRENLAGYWIKEPQLAGVWIKEPQLQALTAKQLAELEKNALNGVNNVKVKERIKKALARLSAPEKDVPDSLPQNYWTDLEPCRFIPGHILRR